MAKKTLKQSLKKIFYLTILLFLKESWFLFTNIIGLIYHPFLTLRKIRQKHDLSQIALVILTAILPLFSALFTTGIVYLAIICFGISLPALIKQLLLLIDFLTLAITFLTFIYLAYWSYQVITKNHYCLFIDKK